MRTVKLKELCKLPEATIFSVWDPNCVFGLYYKHETLKCDDGEPNDFFYSNLLAEYDSESDKPTVDCTSFSRWGTMDDGEEFIIYEESDLNVMCDELALALKMMRG
jgi:hypothetical protein